MSHCHLRLVVFDVRISSRYCCVIVCAYHIFFRVYHRAVVPSATTAERSINEYTASSAYHGSVEESHVSTRFRAAFVKATKIVFFNYY